MLVVAPAGFGKTVAVSQWAQDVDQPVAWYTVDEHDRTAARFWRYLAASLGRGDPRIGAETIRSIEEWAVDGIDMATVLLAELGEAPARSVLVIDEVHLIEPALLEQLAFFVERLPTSVRVVLCSRTDPRLPIARWRARGWVTDIRQQDLALQPAEALRLLRAMTFLDIDDASEQLLIDVTEGWPAALHLACLSLRGRHDAARFVGEVLGSDRMLFDYVVGEILDQLEEEERDAVLALSLLTDIDPARCVIMTGVSDGEVLLERLIRLGLPLVSLETNRRTVRFHDLFRSLVRLELELREAPFLAALRRRAAAAERAAGDDAAAVRHLLAAGERQEAFELVFGPVWDLYRSGSTRDLAVWLDQFPDDFVGSDPARIITFATTLSLIGRLDAAAGWNDRATALLDPADDLQPGLVLSRILVALGRGDTTAVRREVDTLEAAVGQSASRWNPPAAMMTIMALCALVDDDIDAARRWVESIADTPALPERARAVGNPARRAWLAFEEGRLDEAEHLADTSLAESGDERRGAAHAITELFVVKVRLATERLDVDAADMWSERALDMAVELGAPLYRFLAHAATVGAIELRSGSVHASTVADDMTWAEVSEGLLPRYHLLAAEVAARAGRWDSVMRHLADLPPTPRRRLVEADVELGRGEFAAARGLLEDTGALPLRQQIRAQLLRHRATPHEMSHMQGALELGARRGFVWSYLCEGPEVVDVLRNLVGADSRWGSTRLAAALLAQRGMSPVTRVLAEPLSPKEREVLQLFPTHLSTVEMASQLFVSASTVRSHVKAIYRKLEVNSRSEAVVRAQALGLTSHVVPVRS